MISWLFLFECAAVFVLSLSFSLFLTPVFRDAALRFGIVDAPDGELKRQKEPVPYLGGLAFFASVLFPLSAVVAFSDKTMGILLGASVIVLLGLIDDIGRLSPGIKLLVQVMAVFLLMRCGIRIRLEFLPPLADVALTFLWMLLLVNGFNLIDVMDGMAATVGAVSSFFLFLLLAWNGLRTDALLALAVAGALLGFLRFNRHPAQIYLGDAGSLAIGFLLGALAMQGRYTDVHPTGLLSTLFLFSVPLFEIAFLSWVRMRRGVSIFRGSNDHFALRLRQWRLTVPQVVLATAVAAAASGALALAALALPAKAASYLYGCGAAAYLLLAAWLRTIRMAP
jgi:UDP-GlcNAc:undecaprenyl-phosphate GlcNAc-1-phosphate transferase